MPTTTERASLGERVRTLRAEAGMSVRALASEAGFSPSFISQVENGQVSPSIASLERIAAALGATLSGIFASGQRDAVVVMRADSREELSSSWSQATIEALTPVRPGSSLEAVMITIAPGGRSGSQAGVHVGEEFALCFRGEVTLKLDERSHVLGQGDTVAFCSETPHLWQNCGSESAQVVIVSPRFTH